MSPNRRSARPYGSLSRREILDAALTLANTKGLASLSMRNLAESIGSAPMSLYRHFQGKADLEQALVDHVIGSSDLGDPIGVRPRAFVAGAFRTIRATLLAHPGVLPLLGTRPSLGSEGLRGLETILSAIEASPMAPEDAVRAVHALMSFTLGATITEARMFDADGASDAAGLHAVDMEGHPLLVERAALLMDQMTEDGFGACLDLLIDALLPP